MMSMDTVEKEWENRAIEQVEQLMYKHKCIIHTITCSRPFSSSIKLLSILLQGPKIKQNHNVQEQLEQQLEAARQEGDQLRQQLQAAMQAIQSQKTQLEK